MKLAPMALSLLVVAGMLMPPCFALDSEWKALNDQAEALFKNKQYGDAENLFIKAKTFAEQKQLKQELAKTLFDLCWMYDKQNRLLESEGICLQLIALKKQLANDETLEIGRLYRTLGSLQVRQKKLDEAQASLEKAYEIFASRVGTPAQINDDIKTLISIIDDLSQVYLTQGNRDMVTAMQQAKFDLVKRYHLTNADLGGGTLHAGGWDGNDLRSDAQ